MPDASAICDRLGGGGHMRAAGCAPQGDKAAVIDQLLEAIRQAVPRVTNKHTQPCPFAGADFSHYQAGQPAAPKAGRSTAKETGMDGLLCLVNRRG